MDVASQLKILSRGASEIINTEELKSRIAQSLKNKKPLLVKAGFDPTAPDIHLGHVVLLNKLRQFQDLGHKVAFLIGDFTAQIGDPAGREKLRPKMSREEILKNASTYKKQVFKILDARKTQVVFNSSWLAKMSGQEMLELTSFSSVAQVLARADFKERFEEKKEISILEFIYPLLQAYDSVHLKADVEVGGTDQKFNLLMGRQLQSCFGQQQQVVVMTPLLVGLDGVNKMSKSLNNYIGICDEPADMFGKIMSIDDKLMMRYYELLTSEDLEEVEKFHPKEAKLKLAKIIVGRFYPEQIANKAMEEFQQVFSRGSIPENILEYRFSDVDKPLWEILVEAKITASGNEARRLIREGAVYFNNQKIGEKWKPEQGILKVGKRRFLKLIRSK